MNCFLFFLLEETTRIFPKGARIFFLYCMWKKKIRDDETKLRSLQRAIGVSSYFLMWKEKESKKKQLVCLRA